MLRTLTRVPVLVLLALLLLPSVARAHTELRSSDPADSSRLTQPPRRLTLRFTERPELAFSHLQLIGPSGAVTLGPLMADSANAIAADIPGMLPPGEYRVRWQAASSDGHVTHGEFIFVVAGQAPVPLRARAPHTPDPAVETVGEAEQRWDRWMELVALLVVVGAIGFRAGVLPPLAVRGVATSDASDRARRLAEGGVLLYVLAAALRAYHQSVLVHGAARALVGSELVPMLTTTRWGWGWCAGLVGALLVFVAWRMARARIGIGSPLAIVGVVAMIVAPALTGHAAAGRLAPFAVVVDALHVAAVGVWVGGLFHVAFAGVPAMLRLPDEQRDGAVAALINSFHPVALFCAPVVVATGLTSAWLRLAQLSNLWTTAYGKNLAWKLIVFAFVASMGAVNWLRVRPRLGERSATRRVRWTMALELLFATVVLLITAALVTSPAPSGLLRP